MQTRLRWMLRWATCQLRDQCHASWELHRSRGKSLSVPGEAHLLKYVAEIGRVEEIVIAAPGQLERRLGIVVERRQIRRGDEQQELDGCLARRENLPSSAGERTDRTHLDAAHEALDQRRRARGLSRGGRVGLSERRLDIGEGVVEGLGGEDAERRDDRTAAAMDDDRGYLRAVRRAVRTRRTHKRRLVNALHEPDESRRRVLGVAGPCTAYGTACVDDERDRCHWNGKRASTRISGSRRPAGGHSPEALACAGPTHLKYSIEYNRWEEASSVAHDAALGRALAGLALALARSRD